MKPRPRAIAAKFARPAWPIGIVGNARGVAVHSWNMELLVADGRDCFKRSRDTNAKAPEFLWKSEECLKSSANAIRDYTNVYFVIDRYFQYLIIFVSLTYCFIYFIYLDACKFYNRLQNLVQLIIKAHRVNLTFYRNIIGGFCLWNVNLSFLSQSPSKCIDMNINDKLTARNSFSPQAKL